MNSFVNVQVRILAANAKAQLAALNTQLGGMSAGFLGAAGSAGKFDNAIGRIRLEALGSRIQWIGRQLEYNFTLPILAAAGASSKLALDNEAAFARVTKVYGDAAHGAQFYAAEIQSLQKTFVQLSNTYGVAQKDTINIAADWAAAGASGLALAKSVDLTMKTMILGEMNAADSTQALIAIQAQYGLSVDELTKTIAILNMTENQTGISLSGLVQGFARAAGVARSVGVDTRHLAAMLAALTPAAGSAAQAGNALKTIFSRLISPTEETTQVLELMGINMTDLDWKSANMVDRLSILATKFEDLSDAQKGVVSSVIASRWQINKFEILMRELSNPMGYYQKSLEGTASDTAIFTQMQRELNTVLSSNPRRLQIIWTMLQNAAADIIQPMIPMLLHLAQTIQTVVTWFSNLNPGIQKFVVTAAFALALLGPLIRYFGATVILMAELAKIFGFIIGPILTFGRALKWLIAIPLNAFLSAVGVGVRLLPTVFATAYRVMFMVAGAVSAAGWIALRTIWMAGSAALVVVQQLMASALFTSWRAIAVFIGALSGNLWFKTVLPLWRAGIAGIVAVSYAGMIAVSGIFGRVLAIITLMVQTAFWKGIGLSVASFFSTSFLPMLRTAGTAVLAAVTGPWGIAVAIVVGVLIAFWSQLRTLFGSMIKGITAGFNALPQAIQNALLAVVRTIRAAVMKAYELMSYLNPWARHSPSLVDNVTTGVTEIIRQFSTLSNVGSIFQRAGVDLNRFGVALSNIRKLMQDNDISKVRDDLAEFAPAMMGDFDQLSAVLRSLQDELTNVSSTIPVERVKELSDAIFQNDQEQKRLRLEMMQMEDVIGPLDQLQSKIEQINGAIELMGGEQKSLRDKGAGSEILSQYDDQLSALNEQKKAINDQVKPLLDLSAQIDKLSRIGQELDLQQSLALDPITRQMDELNSAIDAVTTSMDAMGQAAQDAAAKTSHISPGAQNFIDAAGGDFADVGGFAQIGREGGLEDQSAAIDDFTKQLADQTKNMFGMFNFLDPIKKGWNNAIGWLKTNIGPGIKAFWGAFTGGISKMGNPFGSLNFDTVISTLKDFGKFVAGIFRDIWTIIGPPIKEIGNILKGAWLQAVKEIGPELVKFKDLLQPLQQLFKELWTILQPVAAIVGGVLLLAFSLLANILKNVLVPVINFIIDLIAGVIKVLRGVIEFIVGVFTGDWDLAWQGIKDIFGGLWDIMFSLVKNALGLIWGVIKGFGEGLRSWWDLLWTHIGDWVKSTWSSILNGITGFLTTILNFMSSVGGAVGGFISNAWQKMTDFISMILGLPGRIASAAVGLFDGFLANFKSNVNKIIDIWNSLSFTIGGGSVFGVNIPSKTFDTPNISHFAKGGMMVDQATAIVGEGRPGYPEYVIPTDPQYRKRALQLFNDLSQSLGISDSLGKAIFGGTLAGVTSGLSSRKVQMMAKGGLLGQTRSKLRSGALTLTADVDSRTINFNGNLEFPNVHDGSDAEEFIRNLEALISEA